MLLSFAIVSVFVVFVIALVAASFAIVAYRRTWLLAKDFCVLATAHNRLCDEHCDLKYKHNLLVVAHDRLETCFHNAPVAQAPECLEGDEWKHGRLPNYLDDDDSGQPA